MRMDKEIHTVHSISVVIPMLDEKEYIRETVSAFAAVFARNKVDYEIIVIDDCSRDGSGTIADEIASSNPRLKVIHNPRRLEYGRCLREGFARAAGEWVFYTDCDMPFDFDIIDGLLADLRDADMVIGYRTGRRESLLRVLYSGIYNAVINILFGLRVEDVNFALKIIRRDLLNTMALRSETSLINAELIIKAKYAGMRIRQVKAAYRPRKYGSSKLVSFVCIARLAGELFRRYPELRVLPKKAV